MKSKSLRGLATISFYAADMLAAKKWYTQLLGIDPYFERPDAEHPEYVEFRIGDYQQELGIIDSSYAPEGYSTKPSGAIAYWHVDDLKETLDTLIAMGATQYQPITDRSQGKGTFVTASVADPFGNILGIMTNVHYLGILGQSNP